MPRTTRLLWAALSTLFVLGVGLPVALAAPSAPSFGGASIEALAAYDGQKTCSPTEKPGTAALRSLVLSAYAGTGDFGIVRDCAVGGVSEHKEGRAWDWRVNAADPAQDAAARDLFTWLLATDGAGNRYALARRLGIMYIIYNGATWSSYNADAGWRPYTGSNPHTDHVHISLSWPGALQQSSYWTGSAGAVGGPASGDAITVRWQTLGGSSGPLGDPLGAEYAVRGGRAQDFSGGQILWSTATGAHGVWGSIGQRYRSLGGPDSPLGLPTTDELGVRGGRASTFQSGQILWSLSTGAQGVWGSIGEHYRALGGPDSPLGLPTTDELGVRGGRASTFQSGQILWSLSTGARAVWGSIGQRYRSLGGPDSPLGLPTTDEQDVRGGRGNAFQSGQILWSPGTGAHGVWGSIGERYRTLGGPESALRLPTSDEYDVPGGRRNDFQTGRLTWTSATGVVTGP